MIDIRLRAAAMLLGLYCITLFCITGAQAQQTAAVVPKLVRFSGSFRPANGMPAQPVESVTLSVYADQTGGNPLWQEIQNVSLDADGHYSVLMGATQNDGMPLELFSSGEPRWLGAQVNRPGETEQPRMLLASVPYALKASDADTLGGKPASAYLLASPTASPNTASAAPSAATPATTTTANATPLRPRVTSGTPGYIGMFINGTDLSNSAMYQGAGGLIGVGTTSPGVSLDMRTGTFPQMGMAQTTDYLTFFASDTYGPAIYWDPAKDMRFGKGGASLYNPYGFIEYMRIQSSTGNVGVGTMTPGSKLDVAGDINMTGNLLYQGSPVLRALTQNNTGFGIATLQSITTGSANTANGRAALSDNTSGIENTGNGRGALLTNTTGNFNTASGSQALSQNINGNSNIAVGYQAAFNVSGGNSNNIHIGSLGFSADSGTIRIGTPASQLSFFAAGIRGVTTGNNDAIPVMIDSAGQLGTVSSSRRFKEDIADMGEASRDLMRLRPVVYRYKKPFADGSKPIQYGLIAEEVQEVYPDLVAHSADGQIETVKYQVLDSMLLNEVQRQQDQIRSLEERLAKLEAALASGVH